MNRRAFGIVELLIALAVLGVLMTVVSFATSFGVRATGRITPQLSLQQQSRRAIAGLLRELQEGMEVVSPAPGCTLSYALVRDKLSRMRWFYVVEKRGAPGVLELWRWVDDPVPGGKNEKLLDDVRRLTFTSRSEGALQIYLLLGDGETEYALLTTVRLRNIAAAEELY